MGDFSVCDDRALTEVIDRERVDEEEVRAEGPPEGEAGSTFPGVSTQDQTSVRLPLLFMTACTLTYSSRRIPPPKLVALEEYVGPVAIAHY